ncbi:DUF418 domain-containing protein [Nonomuraea rhodomycinica]|uniref:DUF418 domain-containing protein n=1 Tax=Nonomuraea rhodomycinica TaxID=1712872 RepID=A0A7Y6IQ08_9ACTN|nr:DUF418 domain-containing protein [Nonomuraea rhodomycinica]
MSQEEFPRPQQAPHRPSYTEPDGRPASPAPPLPSQHEARAAAPPPSRPRIAALDVIRGFALCGILLANVKPIAHMVDAVPVTQAVVTKGQGGEEWPGLFVDQRFFPIFSLLFGVGFSLLLDSASRSVARPRVLLLRRLLALLAIGLVHMFLLWRGDILTIYAVVGLVVLLPSTWLPRWAVAGLAAILIVLPPILGSNGVPLVPGLFLLGSALTRYGVIAGIERATWGPVALFLVFVAGAVAAAWLQIEASADDTHFNPWFGVAGLLTAGTYVCGVLLLLKTPLRSLLQRIFAPLGRMALTNYLTATLLVLLTASLIGGSPDSWTSATVVPIAGGILAVQWLWSTLWLRSYRQGPLEWLWRWATWARRPPLR